MSAEHKSDYSTRHTWIVGVGAISVSVFANLVVLFFATAMVELPTDFPPLEGWSVTIFTITGTFLATVAFWIISRISRNPIRTFQIVAVIVLLISILPNAGLILDPSSYQVPGATPLAAGLLISFHIFAAIICIWFFSTMGRKR